MGSERWLQWCNGGHYFLLDDDACPESGACEEGLADRVRTVCARAVSYRDLLDAGVTEHDVLCLLFADPRFATPCGTDVTIGLAQLVSDRNAVVLERIPEGALATSLEDPEAEFPLVPSGHLQLSNPFDETLQKKKR